MSSNRTDGFGISPELLRLALVSSFLLTLIVSSEATALASSSITVHYTRIDPILEHRLSTMQYDQQFSLVLTSRSGLTHEQLYSLREYGEVNSVIGDVVTIRAYGENIQRIANLGLFSRISTAKQYHPTLEVSVPEIGAPALWQNVVDTRGNPITGRGVVIGIVDTGIDLTHPDFRFPNGTSKVLYVWDQTVQSSQRPEGFSYGTECTPTTIRAGGCPVRDTHGHGTHVAGIAASSGLASKKYQGVAPDALIIFVKAGRPTCDGTNWSFEDNDIIDGVNYIWQKSRKLGIRSTISLSLGGNIGGHDDTSPLETALNRLAEQGAVIVVAAGNSGEDKIHISGQISASSSVTVSWSSPKGDLQVNTDIWYPKTSSISIEVRTPDGLVITGPTPRGGVKTASEQITIMSDETLKAKEWLIDILPLKEEVTRYGWSFTLKTPAAQETAKWNAWVDSHNCLNETPQFPQGSTDYTVGIPGTASGVVTVGAYVTKVVGQAYPLTVAGGLAPFSSIGPTRDGRIKPDIAAPGMFIASARSVDRSPGSADPDDFHTVFAGTSMATPHVAGAIALLLQKEPELTPSQIKSILRESGRVDKFTGSIDKREGSKIWGWGKIDAPGTMGLYAAYVAVRGLEKGVETKLFLDKEMIGTLGADVTRSFAFKRGEEHMIAVDELTQPKPNVRYRVKDQASIKISEASRSALFIYQVEYLLTIVASGGEVFGDSWYERGAVAEIRAKSPSDEIPFQKRMVFVKWSGDLSTTALNTTITMDGPHTMVANWKQQFYVAIDAGGGAVDQKSQWVDSDASITVTAISTEVQGISRTVFRSWSGAVNSTNPIASLIIKRPEKLVASWRTQYYLQIKTPTGTASGEGWYDAGASATFRVSGGRSSLLSKEVFDHWSGDSSARTAEASIVMDGPKRVEAVWRTESSEQYVIGGIVIIIALVGVGFAVNRLRKSKTSVRE